jgi:putative peptide zinc metalloprotease protein
MTSATVLERLRPDIVLGAPLRQGDTVVHYLKDPRTGWYYKLGSREFFLAARLDGRHSQEEIEQAYADRFGRRLTAAHWTSLFDLLRARHLLTDYAEPELEKLKEKGVRERRKTRWRVLYTRIPLVNPDPVLRWVAVRAGLLYSPWFVVPALLAAAVALGTALADLPALYAASRMNLGHPLAVAAFATTWLVVALHETAHGLTSRRFGGAVTEMGLLWRFPLLTPYCKTDDVVLFEKRRHRVYTAFAGVFVNLVALVPFTAGWRLSTPGTPGHALAGSLLFYGLITIALNLLPLLRLDGYFMLNHAIGMADLRAETYRFWGALVRRRPTASYRRADRWTYAAYGLATFTLLGALATGIVSTWYLNLSRWIGPLGAIAFLSTEAVVVAALVVVVRRRRARIVAEE